MIKSTELFLLSLVIGTAVLLTTTGGNRGTGGNGTEQIAEATGSTISDSGRAKVVAPNAETTAPRLFSSNQPLIPPAEFRAAAASPAPALSFVSPAIKPAAEAPTWLSSAKPADEDARQTLTRDLQRELKRVGCYEGDANGLWGASSKRAMAAFTERVNATLPIDEPDYILLTLVKGHAAEVCGQSCPAGQGLNAQGKCLPRAILAQSAKRSKDKTVIAKLESAQSDAAPSQPKTRPQSSAIAGVQRSDNWPTAVAEPATPLPGRMAIGAPVEQTLDSTIAKPTAISAPAKRTASKPPRSPARVAVFYAPRPAYVADRRRWTRTIFSELSLRR